MNCTTAPPARPKDLHWKWGTLTDIEWTDNSSSETSFEVWLCGATSPFAVIPSATSATTGTKYSTTVTIANNTRGCYTVLARNSGGASGFAPGVEFLNTIEGNCGAQIPCGHWHSGLRLQMVASKPFESATTFEYYLWNKGSGTMYNVTVYDAIFGVLIGGPWTLGSNTWTNWRSSSVTSARDAIAFWCTSSSCTDQHWDGVSY